MEPGNGNIILRADIIAMPVFIVLISHHHCLLTIEDNNFPNITVMVSAITAFVENVSYGNIVVVLRLQILIVIFCS